VFGQKRKKCILCVSDFQFWIFPYDLKNKSCKTVFLLDRIF
jgi:hypothetical protein